MKRDGRSLEHRTLEAVCLMAVERARDGEAPSLVIASYGFSRTTIYEWLGAAAKPGIGLCGLRTRPAPGRPHSLTPRQEQQVFHWINGTDPRQYGFDFGLWTRAVVARPSPRQAVGAASAMNAKGGFWCCIYQGGLTAELFVGLLRKMMRNRTKPIHLVVDGLPASQDTAREGLRAIDRRPADVALPPRIRAGVEPG